MTEKHQS